MFSFCLVDCVVRNLIIIHILQKFETEVEPMIMHLKSNVLMIFWLQEMMRRTINKEKNCPEIRAFFGKNKNLFVTKNSKKS